MVTRIESWKATCWFLVAAERNKPMPRAPSRKMVDEAISSTRLPRSGTRNQKTATSRMKTTHTRPMTT